MAEIRQKMRGSTAQLDLYTGAQGQLVVDSTRKDLRLYDGVAPGGVRIPNHAYNESRYLRLDGGSGTVGGSIKASGKVQANVGAGLVGLEGDSVNGEGVLVFNRDGAGPEQDGATASIQYSINSATEGRMRFLMTFADTVAAPKSQAELLRLEANTGVVGVNSAQDYANPALLVRASGTTGAYLSLGNSGNINNNWMLGYTGSGASNRLELTWQGSLVARFNTGLAVDLYGQLRLPDGSVEAPAIQFNHLNSGIYRDSTTSAFVLVSNGVVKGLLRDGLATGPAHYLKQDDGDARYLKLTGGTLTGNLAMPNEITFTRDDGAAYISTNWAGNHYNLIHFRNGGVNYATIGNENTGGQVLQTRDFADARYVQQNAPGTVQWVNQGDTSTPTVRFSRNQIQYLGFAASSAANQIVSWSEGNPKNLLIDNRSGNGQGIQFRIDGVDKAVITNDGNHNLQLLTRDAGDARYGRLSEQNLWQGNQFVYAQTMSMNHDENKHFYMRAGNGTTQALMYYDVGGSNLAVRAYQPSGTTVNWDMSLPSGGGVPILFRYQGNVVARVETDNELRNTLSIVTRGKGDDRYTKHNRSSNPTAMSGSGGVTFCAAGVIAGDGTITQSFGIVSVSRVGTGTYDVTFDRYVHGVMATANLGNRTVNVQTQRGTVIRVETKQNNTSDNQNSDFTIWAISYD